MLNDLNVLLQSKYFTLLLFTILLDLFTGFAILIVNKSSDSNFSVLGIMKSIIVILSLIVMGLYSTQFHYENTYITITIFFIIQYVLSIINTCNVLGIPIPQVIIDKVNSFNNYNKYKEESKNDKKR